MTDVKNWEDQLIAEMRANDGKVTQGRLPGTCYHDEPRCSVR